MRVLLDENMPELLAQHLLEHDCSHVVSIGWEGTKNGKLLKRAKDNEYQVLITLDQQIPFQQDLSKLEISIIVLRPQGQGVKAICALAPQVIKALNELTPNTVTVVSNRPAE